MPKPKKPRVNTAVWVSNLPLDAQKEEIRKLFAKYGLIAEEIDSGDPKIKMYKDDHGNFKGEALVVYFRPESVGLAIQMLDETEFRFGVTSPSGPMRVEVADDSYHTSKKPDRVVQHTAEERRKIAERTKKLNRCVEILKRLLPHADWTPANSRTGVMTSHSLPASPARRRKSSFSSTCLHFKDWRFVTLDLPIQD